jgi:hypothetical protein
MKAQLTRFKTRSFLEDLGNDYNHLHIFFKTETHPEVIYPIMLPYDEFHFFIKRIDAPVGDYLTKIRTGISGYGPKHSKVFSVLEDENFDFAHYLQLYLDSWTADKIESHLEHNKTFNTPNTQQTAAKVMKNFDEIVTDDFRAGNIKHEAFTDEVDQVLHEVTLKYYPDIFDKSPEIISEYRNILSRKTFDFVQSIDKLRHKKEE